MGPSLSRHRGVDSGHRLGSAVAGNVPSPTKRKVGVRWPTRRFVVVLRGARMAAVVSLALAASVTAACGSAAVASPTAKVQRGTVATRVSASGALAAVTSQNVGFSKAARLKDLDVKVSDIVGPDQVLARRDPFTFQQSLNQQRAQPGNQLPNLDRIVHGSIVEGDRDTLAQAKTVLSADRSTPRRCTSRTRTRSSTLAGVWSSKSTSSIWRSKKGTR